MWRLVAIAIMMTAEEVMIYKEHQSQCSEKVAAGDQLFYVMTFCNNHVFISVTMMTHAWYACCQ